MTGEEKRALVAEALTERAAELMAAGDRMSVDAGSAVVGAGLKLAAEHLRAYIEYRLPSQYHEED